MAACIGEPCKQQAQTRLNAISFMLIHSSRLIPAYSSFNLNVEQLNKPMAAIQMEIDYAAVREYLYNVVYFT